MTAPIPPDRYARHLPLEGVGPAGQARLAAARVAVVGCGGLGAPVVQYLAAAGVGSLTLLDDDVIEGSNLNRQVLFRAADIGQGKVERAAQAARELNPSIAITARPERVVPGMARRLARENDLVIDATDGLPSKFLLNDACVAEDRPLVHGAGIAWQGALLFVPGRQGPCLRCLFEAPPPAAVVPRCRDVGVLGATLGVVGSMMAAWAVAHLAQAGGPSAGKYMAVDVRATDLRALSFSRRADCAACGDNPTALALSMAAYDADAACADEE